MMLLLSVNTTFGGRIFFFIFLKKKVVIGVISFKNIHYIKTLVIVRLYISI